LPDVRASRDPLDNIFSFLLILLVVFFLLTVITIAWFLKRIDTDYSKLVAQTIADLRNVHDIAFHSSVTYTHLPELTLARDRQGRQDLLNLISEQMTVNDKLFEQLDHSLVRRTLRPRLEEMESKRRVYLSEYNALTAAINEGKEVDLRSLEWRRVSEAFVSYQNSCAKLAGQIERKSLQKSNDTTAGVVKLRLLFFALGILPLALALLLALAVLYLIWATPTEVELRDQSPVSSETDAVEFAETQDLALPSSVPQDPNLSV
jgi:hypothetical protein